MSTSQPVSLRKVRGAVKDHGDAIGRLATIVRQHVTVLDAHTTSLDGHIVQLAALPRHDSTLWQRVRWLVRGR